MQKSAVLEFNDIEGDICYCLLHCYMNSAFFHFIFFMVHLLMHIDCCSKVANCVYMLKARLESEYFIAVFVLLFLVFDSQVANITLQISSFTCQICQGFRYLIDLSIEIPRPPLF